MYHFRSSQLVGDGVIGADVGLRVGASVGFVVGAPVLGFVVGAYVGFEVVGLFVGAGVGLEVVGLGVGFLVGSFVGSGVGFRVGSSVSTTSSISSLGETGGISSKNRCAAMSRERSEEKTLAAKSKMPKTWNIIRAGFIFQLVFDFDANDSLEGD